MSSIGIKQEFEIMDEKYMGKDDILGKNILSIPNRMNSSRGLMFSNQMDQLVPLEHTEIPMVYTNYEYIVGKYSSAYYKANKPYKVIAKISKFQDNPNAIYVLVIYNKKEDKYDIIERNPGERLTETYGYKYDNSVIDELEEGDEIEQDEVLYHSTSFTKDMMYGFGVNLLTLYTTDPMSIEDALIISKSASKKLASIEYDIVRIALNDNDMLINYYGDRNNYKSFPDIGEHVKDATVAVRRRINYAQALFDLKEENMRKILPSDTPYYVPFAEDKIVDVTIYCNKELDEMEETVYNQQIINYYKNEMEYYEQIVHTLAPIIAKGNHTDDLAELYSRARRIIDPEVKWKDADNKVFSNIIIEFKVEKRVPVVVGSKLAGRYGDKGVISEIRPDEEMPILETGERVEVLENLLGIGNRLNPAKLYEVEINFLSNRIRDKMKSAVDDKVLKEWYFFEYMNTIVTGGGDKIRAWYDTLSDEEQREFLAHTEANRIYVEEPPMYGNTTLEQINDVYEKFHIKPVNAYVQKFGRMIKIMKPVVAGQKYTIKLKHHPKGKTSARSTGFINSKDQPTKTSSTKQNISILPTTPLKFGDMETLNLLMNNNPDALVKMNMEYASSPIGRRDIRQIYENGFVDNIDINPDALNRNVEIFNVNLKMLGLELEFDEE